MEGLARHSIKKQKLRVDADSEEMAIRLQSRMSDINHDKLLPVIQKVMDENDMPEHTIHIDKLTVDLGWLPIDNFYEVIEQRLEKVLSGVIEKKIAEIKKLTATSDTPVKQNDDDKSKTNEHIEKTIDTELDLIAYYLINGVLPWHFHGRSKFNFEELFLAAMAKEQDAVVDLIKKNSHFSQVLIRLVYQLKYSSLKQLLYLLEPKNGALIISYVSDLNSVYLIHPLLLLNSRLFNRLLWQLVLNYSINDRGSQFNRQSFIKYLLQKMARSEGVKYSELLHLLSIGIQKTARNKTLQSSLPALIINLIDEQHKLDLRTGITQEKHTDTPTKSKESSLAKLEQDVSELTSIKDTEKSIALEKEYQIISLLVRLEHYLCSGLNINDHLSVTGRLSAIENIPNNNQYDEFTDLLKLSNSTQSSSTMLMIRQLAKRSKPGLSVLIERLLVVFTPPELLSILMVKERKLIDTWASMLAGSCSQLPIIQPKSKLSSQGVIWQAILQYLMSEASNSWQAESMISHTVNLVASKIKIDSYEFVSKLKLLLDGKTDIRIKRTLDKILSQAKHPESVTRQKKSQLTVIDCLSTQQIAEIFSIYDDMKRIRYFLQYGVLAWRDIQLDEAISAPKAIRKIFNLSSYEVRQCIYFRESHEQSQALNRLVATLSEESLFKLIKLILPQSLKNQEMLFDAIVSSSSEAKYKLDYFKKIIDALLNNKPIDLEEILLGETQINIEEKDKSTRSLSYHELQSELVSRLHRRESEQPESMTTDAILSQLTSNYAPKTRAMIVGLYDTPNLVSNMLKQTSQTSYLKILKVMQPGNFAFLEELMNSLMTIPMPYRPDSKLLRQTLLTESINLQYPVDERFFVRIFSQLFKGSLSQPLKKHLLKSADRWLEEDSLPVMVVSSYQKAINQGYPQLLNFASEQLETQVDSLNSDIQRQSINNQAVSQAAFEFLSGHAEKLEKTERELIIIKLFEQSPQTLALFVKKHIKRQTIRRYWVENLTEVILARLVWLLEPKQFTPLFDSARLLNLAWCSATLKSDLYREGRRELWYFILDFFSSSQPADINRLVVDFVDYFSMPINFQTKKLSKRQRNNQRTNQNDEIESNKLMFDKAITLAKQSNKQDLLKVLSEERRLLSQRWQDNLVENPKAKKNTESGKDEHRQKPKQASQSIDNRLGESFEDGIYIDNAGLILVAVFLPHLFSSLDMLSTTKDGKKALKDSETINRAVHLLQYLVDDSTSTAEPSLVLNKLLCGVSPDFAIEASIALSENEKLICQQLHQAMISRWEQISNTSTEGLQQTFLQREGRLNKVDDGWKLTIQRKTVDILVDQVPWRISIISEAWMPEPVFVSW